MKFDLYLSDSLYWLFFNRSKCNLINMAVFLCMKGIKVIQFCPDMSLSFIIRILTPVLFYNTFRKKCSVLEYFWVVKFRDSD